ncbi:hypothetical protein ACN26Y_24735 [Micromonospora sp. WMMD558]|uniref:hypothetical protein n=1 Tax=unclassified Micromonospora TaxID=2617518 RepID=UPI0012B486E0|nr:hypothetical protein [Micromonospora sp. WMMC415]QGN49190.1 hypothetical protein GKC29_21745 [Micromonospora sp. WMMC415]
MKQRATKPNPPDGERFERRLDWLMGALALLFLVVVLAEPLSRNPTLSLVLTITIYVLWAAFIAEFLLRLWIASDRRQFLKRNWWRIIILAVPILRTFALLRALRIAAFAQVISSAVRGSHSVQLLSGRVIRLAVFTAIVILVATHLVYLSGGYSSYLKALHDTAISAFVGQPIIEGSGVGEIIEVVLAAYSVLVFATLAGSIGAFFLGDDRERRSDAPEQQR